MGSTKHRCPKPGAAWLQIIAVTKLTLFFFFGHYLFVQDFLSWKCIAGFLLMHLWAALSSPSFSNWRIRWKKPPFPLPTAQGIIENEWAIHQMNTTVNFSPQ
jgi:linoleoyl-CoA desaturase